MSLSVQTCDSEHICKELVCPTEVRGHGIWLCRSLQHELYSSVVLCPLAVLLKVELSPAFLAQLVGW